MRRATAFVALLLGLGALGCFAVAVLAPGGSSAAPVAASSLVCSVKASPPGCGVGEVEVFRMSSTGNAHAGTPGGSSYGNVVCCGGVTGLGADCSGTYDTVLRLSAADNAHVQASGDYPEEVCLSAGTAVVQCAFAINCTGGGYACLATASGADNAHVADCDGTDDYQTKVCCYAGDPIAVGGIAELPGAAQAPAGQSGSSPPPFTAIAGGLAAVLAVTAGAWYARRRWLR